MRHRGQGPAEPGRLSRAFARSFPALTHANFRYFWFGQCISLIGTWMQTAGQSWLVLIITDSALKLGIVNAMQFTPILLFSLFAGVFIDRFSKKKIILWTQSISAVLALVLGVLVLTNRIQYWHLLILAGLLGTTNAIDNPARQAFMTELVGREDLMNAVALNSSIFNLARIVGPAIAGIMMDLLGAGWCFVLNAISFVPVIVGIFMIRPIAVNSGAIIHKGTLAEIGDGLRYIRMKAVLFWTLIVVCVMNMFAMNSNVFIPVMARDSLGLGAAGYGILLSAQGVGSLIGALLVAVTSRTGPAQTLIRTAAMGASALLVILGLTKTLPWTMALLVLFGFSMILCFTNANSTMQMESDDAFRGRVMSLYSLVLGGTSPFGNLITGALIGAFGVAAANIGMGAASVVLLFVALMVERRTTRRPQVAATP